MSKLFFDHLLELGEVETFIKKSASSKEELEELYKLVDDVVIGKAIDKVLGKLPGDNHEEFLALFHKCPHDQVVIFEYLNTKIGKNVEEDLREEFKEISSEIIKELIPQDEVVAEIGVSKK